MFQFRSERIVVKAHHCWTCDCPRELERGKKARAEDSTKERGCKSCSMKAKSMLVFEVELPFKFDWSCKVFMLFA